jgi:hypothetical protein
LLASFEEGAAGTTGASETTCASGGGACVLGLLIESTALCFVVHERELICARVTRRLTATTSFSSCRTAGVRKLFLEVAGGRTALCASLVGRRQTSRSLGPAESTLGKKCVCSSVFFPVLRGSRLESGTFGARGALRPEEEEAALELLRLYVVPHPRVANKVMNTGDYAGNCAAAVREYAGMWRQRRCARRCRVFELDAEGFTEAVAVWSAAIADSYPAAAYAGGSWYARSQLRSGSYASSVLSGVLAAGLPLR